MAVTMTFTTLQADIIAELERDDLATQVLDFIDGGERKIAQELRPRGFEVFATSTMTIGDEIITQPVRVISYMAFHILTDSAGTATGNQRREVFRRTYDFARAYAPDRTSTGMPRFYAGMGADNLIVVPSPVAAYVFELAYLERLQPLDSGNATNWLTVNAPQLLLYASLLEAAPWLRDDDRIATWQSMYDRWASGLQGREMLFATDMASSPGAAATGG